MIVGALGVTTSCLEQMIEELLVTVDSLSSSLVQKSLFVLLMVERHRGILVDTQVKVHILILLIDNADCVDVLSRLATYKDELCRVKSYRG